MRAFALAAEPPDDCAGVLDRNALFAALGEAVGVEHRRTVLVLFGFEGIKEFLANAGAAAGDRLLARLGGRLIEAVGDAGDVFASRRGEFCALLEGHLGAVRSLLVTIPAELDAESRTLGIRCSLGIAVLPDEASVPTYALALADRRLRALSGDLRAEHR